MHKREIRMIGGLELRSLTDAEKSEGYIGALEGKIPFNTDSKPLRDRRMNNGQPFVERIAPGAFSKSLTSDELMGAAGHTDDPLAMFARAGANLSITEDKTGISFRALLPDTSAARDLRELVTKKIIRGTSFEFDVGAKDSWEKRADGTAVRTVVEGRLAAINPVAWPAYDDSELSVTMRSHRRGFYAGAESYDYSLTCDAAYAMDALCAELEELGDALDYLRCVATPGTSSSGALADYAKAQVTESAAAVAQLTAWLAENGAAVNPDLMQRAKGKLTAAADELAKAKLTEARSTGSGQAAATAPTKEPEKISPGNASRERRGRVLAIAPISPLPN